MEYNLFQVVGKILKLGGPYPEAFGASGALLRDNIGMLLRYVLEEFLSLVLHVRHVFVRETTPEPMLIH